MIENIIKCVIVAIVLCVLYYIATILVSALGAPSIVLTLVAVVLALVFCLYLVRAFGVSL